MSFSECYKALHKCNCIYYWRRDIIKFRCLKKNIDNTKHILVLLFILNKQNIDFLKLFRIHQSLLIRRY